MTEIHPGAYEILKAATGDIAQFEDRDGKTYGRICLHAAYAAVSKVLFDRDEALTHPPQAVTVSREAIAPADVYTVLVEARSQLEAYEQNSTGEQYNWPELNELIDRLTALKDQSNDV